MKYANGRPAKLNDRVVAVSPSGTYIGTVVAFENNTHIRVMPLFCQAAIYHDESTVFALADALVPSDKIAPFTD